MAPEAPDVVLVCATWPARALLRAQLIEQGYEVVAIDGWPIPRQYLHPLFTPRLVVIDRQGLSDPQRALGEATRLFDTGRVLIVTALGTVPPEEIRASGCHVVARPATVGRIVREAAQMLLASA